MDNHEDFDMLLAEMNVRINEVEMLAEALNNGVDVREYINRRVGLLDKKLRLMKEDLAISIGLEERKYE